MKLYVELLIAAAVGSSVYAVAIHDGGASHARRATDSSTRARDGLGPGPPAAQPDPLAGANTRADTHSASTATVAPAAPHDARAEHDERMEMNALRNAIIAQTAEDMRRRGADLLACTRSLDLVGTEKLKFSVATDSSRGSADVGPWRFREIVDGEALPGAFATCAERALGQGGHITAAQDTAFPDYRGDLELVYTIPVPP